MTTWIPIAVAVVSVLLNAAQFYLGQQDRSMRYADHWKGQVEGLIEENDRLRGRIDDTENHCAAQIAALRTENDALGQRLLKMITAEDARQRQQGVQP